MNQTDIKNPARRRHSAELKRLIVAQCAEPGASIAKVARTHGLNANLVHKWRTASAEAAPTAGLQTVQRHSFVPISIAPTPSTAPPPPLAVPAPDAAQLDIRIELRRGPTHIMVSWPLVGAQQCAAWMRELVK